MLNNLLSTRVVIPLCLMILVSGMLSLDYSISRRIDDEQAFSSHSAAIETTLLHLTATTELFLESGTVQQIADSISAIELEDHISMLFVTDPGGNVIASLQSSQLGEHWSAIEPAPSLFSPLSVGGSSRLLRSMDGNALAGLSTLCSFPAGASTASSNCGAIYLEMNMGELLAANKLVRFNGLLIAGTGIVLAAMIILIILSSSVTNRADDIINSIDRFKAGNRRSRIPPRGFSELKTLSQSINGLFEKIQQDEKSIIEKRTRYASLIETMPDGLITVRKDGTIESMNLAVEKLLGFRQKELVGSNLSLFITDSAAEDAESYLNGFIEDAKKDDSAPDREVEVRSKKGKVFPIRLSLSRMEIEDEEIFIGVLSDISRIKSMEKELRALNKELSATNERLEETVITDPLTGLYNRRHFDNQFLKELARSTRQRTSISLLVVDIDFFKQYNDRYGHALGDECLTKVSDCLKSVFKRSGDLPARYGGEEFSIILPGCDGLELQERAETLRAAVTDLKIPHSASRVDEVLTISIGAVTYKPQSSEVVAPKPKELFTEADKALYRAKASGRNRVVFAGQYQPIPIPSATGHFYGHLLNR